jgi:DNA-binding NarL/FixJ family response regulator
MMKLTQDVERPVVSIVDRLPLRKAELDSFLRPWAEEFGLSVEACPSLAQEGLRVSKSCKLAVINIGGDRFEEAGAQESVRAFRDAAPETPIVVISDDENPEDVLAAFEAGVSGFVPNSTEPAVALQILTLIMNGGSFFPPRALLRLQRGRGGHGDGRDRRSGGNDRKSANDLTARQQEVLHLLGTGKSNKAIARELQTCEATVKVHVRQIMRKLRVANRTEAALICAAQEGPSELREPPGRAPVPDTIGGAMHLPTTALMRAAAAQPRIQWLPRAMPRVQTVADIADSAAG